MHNYKPNQKARIITLQIAVDADVPVNQIADEISAILSENAMTAPDTSILDWQYIESLWGDLLEDAPVVTLSDDPEEGEAFTVLEEV